MDTLRTDTAASIGGFQSAFLRKVLVAGQVALSLAVLIVAGLFVRTLHNLRPHDLRVDPNRVLQFMIKPQPEIYSDARKFEMLGELIRHVSQIPGVEFAALTQPAPFVGDGGNGLPIEVPGGNSARITANPACSPQQAFYNVMADLFEGTAGEPLFPRLYDPATTSIFPGGTKPGSAPLNYLQLYRGNLKDASGSAAVNTGVGASRTYSGQDILQLAAMGLAQTAEAPLPANSQALQLVH